MGTKLTDDFIARCKPDTKPYEVADAGQPGLLLRVQPSGVKSYIVQYGRGKRVTLKRRPPGLMVKGARTQAREILTDADKHGTPAAAKPKVKASTLGDFIDTAYAPWALANRKWGAGAAKRIKAAFDDWVDKPLTNINPWVGEKWRSQRLKAGIAEGTVNRELAGLKAALAKAVEWKMFDAHPLAPVKLKKIDNARVRYLAPAEEKRLRDALAARDRKGIAGRESGNRWRAARGHPLLRTLPAGGFFDHLSPMVLLALNTGLRRGELVALEWSDVNLQTKDLLVRAAAAKSAQSRHVPLNKEAATILTRWKKQSGGEGRVFNVRDVKTAWLALMKAAKIERFNFHDLRHTFASKLVMAGVDLNTVRELLGHAEMKMTLRYAHLAQEHKQSAVDKLMPARSR
jgi:integrase